ncbi:glycosyltransferase family 4 protein [Sphingomonas sp. NBWT7]|uniref:glycosyltransferase family 4 protein n=1 Tax=Sphingomonas sp. NBWT7 TaxID=2596913 RepID=UPI0016252506|nr:glycosyltransferase family 4 protein [Sphingomonas sp. NBWT7]QNE32450.1 glycosyltransferase family 4 protein [Sphingomonas sp. NBWT7]
MRGAPESATAAIARRVLILSCVDGLGPTGVDTHIRAAVRILEEAGREVEIVHPHGVRTPELLLIKVAQRIAGKLATKETRTRLARLAYARALRVKLRRRLRAASGRPVTIYAQDSISSATAGQQRQGAATRVVTVVHFNRSEAEELAVKGLTQVGGPLYRSAQAWERRSMVAADRILFVSDFMRHEVLGRYGPDVAARSSMLGLWPEDEIAPSSREEAQRDLIAIGTLEPRKNQRFLLEVLSACVEHGYRYTLTLIGDGPDRAALEAEAETLGIADLIDFRGRVNGAQDEIGRHRALIHAALLENMPLTLIETLAHGRPVFCFALGGMPEIVRDGVEGMFLSPDDAAASADKVIALLENRELLTGMERAARTRFEAHFSKAVAAAVLLSELDGPRSTGMTISDIKLV